MKPPIAGIVFCATLAVLLPVLGSEHSCFAQTSAIPAPPATAPATIVAGDAASVAAAPTPAPGATPTPVIATLPPAPQPQPTKAPPPVAIKLQNFDARFPAIPDDGGAPTQVVLRVRTAVSDTITHRERTEYYDPKANRWSAFVVRSTEHVQSEGPDQFTADIQNLGVLTLRDDFKMEPKIRPGLLAYHLVFTMNATGQLVSSSDKQGGVSFDFPTDPVGAGSLWTGGAWRRGAETPAVFHLDRIVRHQGRNYAQITANIPATPTFHARYWFDATLGAFAGHEFLDQKTLHDGSTLFVRSFPVEKSGLVVAVGKAAP